MKASTAKIKSLVPWHEIEAGAQEQIYDNAEIDIVKSIAVMPDVHQGYDLPIGAVALVDSHICPSFVGYDIGCGMCFVNTGVLAGDVLKTWADKKVLHDNIKYGNEKILVGFDRRTSYHPNAPNFTSASGDKSLTNLVNELNKFQYGTLGGGNHFIEIGESRKGYLCITIHSGSRKCGHDIGDYYIKKAEVNGLYRKFLHVDSDLGRSYLQDMNFFLDWALGNRLEMIRATLFALGFNFKQVSDIIEDTLINENHNHAVCSPNGIIHRKGATPADAGQLGVIPGNMRDGTYITIGLGNDEFLSSASHGAGRLYGRKAAKRQFSLEDVQLMFEGYEVYTEITSGMIDECPEAYKPLEQVIAYQAGVVVDIVDHITPLIVVKGNGL